MQGFYIVIEGPQGVGKSTQVKLLANALNVIGVPVKSFKEPDSSANITTQKIRQITQDPKYPLNPKAEVLLYNASRAVSLETIINYKNKGFVCIVDRSFLSTLAVQYYDNNNIDYNSIINIINFSVGNHQPDYMLILDAPAQYLHQRQLKRKEHERFDALGLAKLDKIRAGYLIEAKKRNIPVIVATESPIKVHNKIWNNIQKVLNNNYIKQSYLLTKNNEIYSNYEQTPKDVISINNIQISELLVSKISKLINFSYNDNKDEYDYIVPSGLPSEAKSKYIQTIKKIANYNLKIINKQNDYNIDDTLPLSTIKSVNLFGEYHLYKKVLEELQNTKSQESLKVYNIIKNKLQKFNNRYINSNFFSKIENNSKRINISNQELNKQVNNILAKAYSNSLDLISLTSFAPKNELSLLSFILFKNTELSIQEINAQLTKSAYLTKANIFSKYVKINNLTELPVYYNYEIITSYSNYLEFNKLDSISISSQIITPRYGYDIPKQIEDSTTLDEYLECFDASLELHSILVSNNVPEEVAQYACLKGHKLRFNLQINIRQSLKLIKLFYESDNKDLKNIAKYMVQKISETHPLLSEAVMLD